MARAELAYDQPLIGWSQNRKSSILPAQTDVEKVQDGARSDIFRVGSLPPLPEMMVLCELAQCAADGRSDMGLDEAVLVFATRFVDLNAGRSPISFETRPLDWRRALRSQESWSLAGFSRITIAPFRSAGAIFARIPDEDPSGFEPATHLCDSFTSGPIRCLSKSVVS